MEGLNCCCGENSTFNGFNNGYLCKEKSFYNKKDSLNEPTYI